MADCYDLTDFRNLADDCSCEFVGSMNRFRGKSIFTRKIVTMFGVRKHAVLASLSQFAGRHLALASSILVKDGFFIPSGMTSSLNLWSGVTENVTLLDVEDPKLVEAAARQWFMTDHKKARFVSLALDSYVTIDGVRMDAIMVSARHKDLSTAILVFDPYTPAKNGSPVRLHEPEIDFPREVAHLNSKHDLVLANVLDGRNRSPLHPPKA
jgi:hypothetical protein